MGLCFEAPLSNPSPTPPNPLNLGGLSPFPYLLTCIGFPLALGPILRLITIIMVNFGRMQGRARPGRKHGGRYGPCWLVGEA